MDSVLRKFRLRKERRESEARQKLKKELFAFNTCVNHGFPHKPSALAYDPKLHLLAIGTKLGDIRVYGSPGVEYSGLHRGLPAVTHVNFLPGQGRLITVCADGSVHLWQINEVEGGHSIMVLAKSLTSATNGNLKGIHACCVTSNCEQLMLGVECGDILIIDILSFKLTERVIRRDAVVLHAPEEFKSNSGRIVDVLQHPTSPSKFLIGYSRGLIVLWDDASSVATHTYNSTSQQLESLSFVDDGREFISAHADGSYVIWSSSEVSRAPDQANTPYGPFPCNAISRILWKSAKPEPFIIFSGGMPRASHGEKHTVSVMQGATHVVFDFSSKVVAFRVLSAGDEFRSSGYNDPHSLVVLTDEEVVVVDLTSDRWLTHNLPYLNSIHSSAILCTTHVTSVPDSFWNKLVAVGEEQCAGHSTREWPICGGKNLRTEPESHDLLLTGHEDGSVHFWDVSTTSMSLVYKLSSSVIFGFAGPPQVDMTKSQELEDEWPPFRKVGTYDPFSDPPQLGIQKISFCCHSETLVLGGTAGQIIVLSFNPKPAKLELQVSSVNIVAESDSCVWKGHDPLNVVSEEITYAAGFQPSTVVQLHPPSLCTSLAVHTEWKLIAIGTAFGYALFDYHQNKEVFARCTLTAAGEGAAPRRKSFKKSIRESFRRLRGRRAGQHHRAKTNESKVHEAKQEQTKSTPVKKEPEEEGQIEVAASGEASLPPSPSGASPSASPKHTEQKTESRTADDVTASVARCVYFADTFLLNAQEHGPTLWIGTNGGTVYIHQIVLPSGERRDSESVTASLAKEIQLRHGAPVILISVTDRTVLPLSDPLMLEQGKAPDMSGGHQVVICSEEQFKLFSLPYLKSSKKFKFTARDGTKVRKASMVNFRSKSDENYVEHDLACLTNTNQIHVFTVPQLRSQLKGDISESDNGGVGSGLFTVNGEGFFLVSVSEFLRLSLSAHAVNKPLCTVGVTDGSRPALLLEEAEQGHLQGQSSAAAESHPAAVATTGTSGEQSSKTVAAVAVTVSGHSDDANKMASDETTTELNETDPTAGTSTTAASAQNATGELVPSEAVKMQMSESSTSSVIVRNVLSSRTVTTKTTISTTTDDGTVTETSTSVQHMNTGHVHLSGDENVIPITQEQ